MKTPLHPRRWRDAWRWPALLNVSCVFALITVLVADGRTGWNLPCWLLLLVPAGIVMRALWR